MFPSGPPILEMQLVYLGWLGGGIDRHPQSAMRGPQLPTTGSGTVISAENQAITDSSTGLIERTKTAPSRTADWGTMASPMTPIVVDSGTLALLRR